MALKWASNDLIRFKWSRKRTTCNLVFIALGPQENRDLCAKFKIHASRVERLKKQLFHIENNGNLKTTL
jgi:hypothetical protein